eukprot:m.995367 g.995367  ORF g.995367 m.995367 type:complete len:129 (+) comp24016_c0_seq19:489-875(+)
MIFSVVDTHTCVCVCVRLIQSLVASTMTLCIGAVYLQESDYCGGKHAANGATYAGLASSSRPFKMPIPTNLASSPTYAQYTEGAAQQCDSFAHIQHRMQHHSVVASNAYKHKGEKKYTHAVHAIRLFV